MSNLAEVSQEDELKEEIAYKSNINLKRANAPLEFEEWQIEEIKKCSEDIVYFAENYVKVVHPDYGFIPFTPYDYQRELIEILQNNKRAVINQSRQSGKSQAVATFLLWEVLFKSHHTAAILANKADTAQEILNTKLKVSYEALPYWLQQGVLKWNERSIFLENGSRVLASATSSSAIRGFTVNCVDIETTKVTMRDIETGEVFEDYVCNFIKNEENINNKNNSLDGGDELCMDMFI